jgi:hypothetical protein
MSAVVTELKERRGKGIPESFSGDGRGELCC